MKNLILLILGLSWQVLVFAQTKEGVITYEVKMNLHRRIPKEQQEMKNMIPEFRISQTQLFFNQTTSLYKNLEEPEEDEESDNGGGVTMRFTRPQNEFYFDFGQKRKVEMRDFMSKKFLIEDSIKNIPWKLVDETQTIQGYTCKKATYYNEERKQNLMAWYAEKIPLMSGPEAINTLPGMILALDINEGEIVITAKKVEVRPLQKNELKVPNEGKKITAAEFKKLVDEQMKQMGGNGTRIIRH
ncbi:MAG: GLPGLI family protein [Microscillaceae bacterium]|jgi:GLPGLI family protein|nr:GLPGLI family protein [Microscillaceae bacterium]